MSTQNQSVMPQPKPSLAVSVALAVVAVGLWGWLNLVVFHERVMPLSYAIPLLIGVWHRRPWLLWSMAAACLALAAVEVFWATPDAKLAPSLHWPVFFSRLVNIAVAGGVVHAMVMLRDRLEANNASLEAANTQLQTSNAELETANEELAAREEEISRQNEELQSQSEEVAQQNEELKAQGEELEQQNEELQSQSEELQTVNGELARREEMLQALLTASGALSGEGQVLTEVCRKGLQLLGGDVIAVAVMEARDDVLQVHSHTGVKTDDEALIRWPLKQSLARLVMQENRTAALEDMSLRADLIFPQPIDGTPFRSMLATPLRVGQKAVGAIEFYAARVRPWTEDQFRLAEWLAAQCSAVLEMMRLRSELVASESRFRTLADAMPQLAWIAHADGFIHWYNRRWYEYTGTTPPQMEGWGWQSVHDPRTLPAVMAQWKKSIATGEPFDMTFPLRGADGVFRPFLTRVMPLKDDQGRVVQWFGTNTDVNELARAQESLTAAKAAAEEASRAKDQFLAVLSHELRTPLTPVLLTASLLANRRDLPADVREDIDTIQRNVQLETRLIDDLLDLTRIARGKVKFEFQSIDAHLLIRSAADICGRGEGARIELELKADPRWVRADSARLQQVFWNLLNNARKFTPPDGMIHVTSCNCGDGRMRVEVRDSGCGIDAAFLPRVFDAFEQAGSEGSGRPSGLGLGMAISKAIMQAHEGSIAVHSEGKGRGSTFTVELALAAPSRAGATADPPQGNTAAVDGPALRILLVEDHDSTRNVLRKLLLTLGHEAQAASNVEVAKQVAGQGRFDLVISDLGLPDGTGHELMRWLKQEHGLKGIALSGYGMEDDIRTSLECGFVEHLTKPVSLPQLEAVLRRVAQEASSQFNGPRDHVDRPAQAAPPASRPSLPSESSSDACAGGTPAGPPG